MVIVREVSRVLHRSTSNTNSSSVPQLPPALDTTPPQQQTQQQLSRSPLQQPVSTSSPLLSHVPQPPQQQQQSLEELGSLNLSRESEDLVVKVYPLKMKSMLLTFYDLVCRTVFRIRDILIRIRILRTLGYGSCSFRQWLSRSFYAYYLLYCKYIYISLQTYQFIKKSQNS
jgi:hypothetical protein